MKFDISKVVYVYVDGELSTNIKNGTKGYFGNNIGQLKFYVKCEVTDFYGELTSINNQLEFAFEKDDGDDYFVYFYPCEYPKEEIKNYRPYTWEEACKFLLGKVVKHKNTKLHTMVTTIHEFSDTDVYIGTLTAEQFFNEYEWLDGSPCGMPIEECTKIKKE